MADHRLISPSAAPTPLGPYSPAVGFERLIFVSGQGARDPSSGMMPDGIEAQTEACLRNVESILKAGLDALPLPGSEPVTTPIGDHANVRGPGYYE